MTSLSMPMPMPPVGQAAFQRCAEVLVKEHGFIVSAGAQFAWALKRARWSRGRSARRRRCGTRSRR